MSNLDFLYALVPGNANILYRMGHTPGLLDFAIKARTTLLKLGIDLQIVEREQTLFFKTTQPLSELPKEAMEQFEAYQYALLKHQMELRTKDKQLLLLRNLRRMRRLRDESMNPFYGYWRASGRILADLEETFQLQSKHSEWALFRLHQMD